MKFVSRWAPPIIVMAIMYWFSAQAVLPGPGVIVWLDFVVKKIAHLTEYAVLFFTWQRALNWGRPIEKRQYAASFIIIALWAVSDEIHQSFTPSRHPKLMDVGIDLIGSILMYLKLTRFG